MIENATPEQLAVFVQEYIRREDQPDAGVLGVIAADLRDPHYPPHHVAEYLLARAEIQAAIKAAKSFYKPPGIKEITADTILADAESLYQRASDDRAYPAALAAKKLQSEILGLLKKEVTFNVKHSVTTLTDEQLEAIAKRGVIDAEFKDITGVPAVING